jgi:hypothetical protein
MGGGCRRGLADELSLETCDALDMPARLEALSVSEPSAHVLAYQTVFADYLLPDDRTRYESIVRAWLLANVGDPSGRSSSAMPLRETAPLLALVALAMALPAGAGPRLRRRPPKSLGPRPGSQERADR